MKIKYLLFIGLLALVFDSCKSKKKVTSQKKTTKEVVSNAPDSKIQVVEDTKPAVKPPISYANATIGYIATYNGIAMEEMKTYGIPASITLAQGILESGSGRSELTRKSNNHFGIKCHKGWKGKKAYHDDDKKGECFRVYKDPHQSFRDHSMFLVGRERYKKLFTFDKGDYVKWAKGLSQAGYATDRRYPAKLIALIEKYNLDEYDKKVLGKKYKEVNLQPVNTDVHIVEKGDTLYSISKKYGMTVFTLKRLNKLSSNTISIGQKLRLN